MRLYVLWNLVAELQIRIAIGNPGTIVLRSGKSSSISSPTSLAGAVKSIAFPRALVQIARKQWSILFALATHAPPVRRGAVCSVMSGTM
eukprot:3324503-Rhodomonas_salina.6